VIGQEYSTWSRLFAIKLDAAQHLAALLPAECAVIVVLASLALSTLVGYYGGAIGLLSPVSGVRR